jgi:repressor LexA
MSTLLYKYFPFFIVMCLFVGYNKYILIKKGMIYMTNSNSFYKVIGKKIKEIRTKKGWSLERLGEQIGKTKKTVQRYENGEHKLPLETMKQITDALDYDWKDFEVFMTNEFNNTNQFIEEPATPYVLNKGYLKVYGKICAGNGKFAFEDLIDEIICPYPRAKGDMIALQVDGESMNKIIPNGVYAMLNLQPTVENGQIVAVIIDHEDAMLKRFYKVDDETIMLKPESNDTSFKAKTFIGEEINKLKIIGKYIGYVTPYVD